MEKFKVTLHSDERGQAIVVRAESEDGAVAEASRLVGPLKGDEAWKVERLPEAFSE